MVASKGESTDTTQEVEGVEALNRLINFEIISGSHIALLKEVSGNLIQGKEITPVPGMIEILSFQYYLGANLRIPFREKTLQRFKSLATVTTLNAPPSIYYPKRTESGIDLLLYAHPAENYPYEMQGIRALDNVLINSEIMGDTVFYTDYLLYLLADELRLTNNRGPNTEITKRIKMYQRKFGQIKPRDYTVELSRLGKQAYCQNDPASAQIMQGWYV
ncbi:MAG: hypothetical protein JKY48_02500 [Flavobacteriales bacterium]|nr:hypothetical protein [Flavobacteriales bacterium]